MSIPVDLAELADAMAVYRFAYLLSIADDGRPHAVAVVPHLADGALVVGDLGRRSSGNLAARPAATLLWPPADPAGYSLIVDGDATSVTKDPAGDGVRSAVTIAPTRAVLHRSAAPGDDAAGGHSTGGPAAGDDAAGAASGSTAVPVAGGPAPGCVSDCVEINVTAGR